MPPNNPVQADAPRIIHLVTGGGSGATRMAIDLAIRQQASGRFAPLLLLRRKRNPLPESMLQDIRSAGVPFAWIENSLFHFKLTSRITRQCLSFAPRIFVAHGNSEHIWGRAGAIRAAVPVIVHIEHNIEKYTPLRLLQARNLAPQTDATICVSKAVENRVRKLKLASPLTGTIPNGISLSAFAETPPPLAARSADILMAARFGRQKDHATLIRAIPALIAAGWKGRLLLAGGGKKWHLMAARRLVKKLRITPRVSFLGRVENIPELLRHTRVFVLSTHYEGLPLSIAEAMAAGCLVIASRTPGVTDIVEDNSNGLLFPEGDSAALAQLLRSALFENNPYQALAAQARSDAIGHFSLNTMALQYERFFEQLSASRANTSRHAS